MSKLYVLDDGSVIEWVDKGTLRYTENGFSVSIWVDFEPGFFNSGRIIKSSSIVRWDSRPEGNPDVIGMDKRKEILAKVQQYYQARNRKFRIEES
jgi:hypothetical protein